VPYSDPSNIEWIKWVLDLKQPKTVLDIGAGAGKYGRLVKEVLPDAEVTGVEIWGPYVKQFGLDEIYDTVHICDARIYPFFSYDMVFLGDVLEHMTRSEATDIWRKVSRSAKYAVVSIPIVHFPQGDFEGNPFEIHVEDHWTHDEVLEYFPGITGYQLFEKTGIYIAEF
jgi:SAM-dependent methyltransferase